MFYYSFNDSFEKKYTDNEIKICLYESLLEFKIIFDKYPIHVKVILTDRTPCNISMGNNKFLSDIILLLDRDQKNYALKNFTKYPIENFYPELNIEEILKIEYSIEVNNKHHDALCAKINYLHDGFLFSLALHDDLKKDKICIFENKIKKDYIDNLYGNSKNTTYNLSIIENKIQNSKVGFEKFLSLFKKVSHFQSLKEEYLQLTSETQEVIYQKLVKAKGRNLPTSFASDKSLIKDVTPSDENDIKLFELRIFDPVAVRLYFYEESKESIYLASIKKKPAKKVQTNDINTSIALIKSLIKLQK
jgi:hypothetical protein